MTGQIATSREPLSTRAARVRLGWWLRRDSLRRLRVLGHGVGNIGGHARKSNGAHIGLGHVERGVHCARGAIWASVLHAAVHGRLRVPRVFGSVRRVGAVHGNLRKLLVSRLFWSGSLNTWN